MRGSANPGYVGEKLFSGHPNETTAEPGVRGFTGMHPMDMNPDGGSFYKPSISASPSASGDALVVGYPRVSSIEDLTTSVMDEFKDKKTHRQYMLEFAAAASNTATHFVKTGIFAGLAVGGTGYLAAKYLFLPLAFSSTITSVLQATTARSYKEVAIKSLAALATGGIIAAVCYVEGPAGAIIFGCVAGARAAKSIVEAAYKKCKDGHLTYIDGAELVESLGENGLILASMLSGPNLLTLEPGAIFQASQNCNMSTLHKSLSIASSIATGFGGLFSGWRAKAALAEANKLAQPLDAHDASLHPDGADPERDTYFASLAYGPS